MSLPLFLTRNHGTLFLVKTSVRADYRKWLKIKSQFLSFPLLLGRQ